MKIDQSDYVFKIRNCATGLYSKGGNPACWSKKGKSWSGTAQVKAHLRMQKNIPMTWEVVVFKRIPTKIVIANFLLNSPLQQKDVIELIEQEDKESDE